MPRWILWLLPVIITFLTFLFRPTTWRKTGNTVKRPFTAYGKLNTQTKLNLVWRGFEFFAILAGITALWFSVIGTQQAIEQTKLSREAFIEQQKWGAWSVLSTDGANERATVYAIEKLVQLDQTIYGVELSCQSISNDTEGSCRENNQLLYMNLNATDYAWLKDFNFANRSTSINLNSIGIDQGDFSGASLRGEWSNIWVRDTTFKNALIHDLLFYDSQFVSHVVPGRIIEKTFEEDQVRFHSIIENVSFAGAALESVDFEGADIRLADFSSARMAWVDFGYRDWPLQSKYKYYGNSQALGFAMKPTINISGAVLCDAEKGDINGLWPPCTYGIDGIVAKKMWYYENQPPIGIELDRYKEEGVVACLPLTSKNAPPDWAIKEFGPTNMRGYTCPSIDIDLFN
jgi:uncharacterized protein YjbI with pentapeptide repeats